MGGTNVKPLIAKHIYEYLNKFFLFLSRPPVGVNPRQSAPGIILGGGRCQEESGPGGRDRGGAPAAAS